jgi:hypothetical protein
MSIFGDILNKIVGAAEAILPQAITGAASAAQRTAALPAATAAAETPAASHPAAATPIGEVDVEAILTKVEEQHGGGSNWRTSIVDLLKLLDLDSSLNARKELGHECRR